MADTAVTRKQRTLTVAQGTRPSAMVDQLGQVAVSIEPIRPFVLPESPAAADALVPGDVALVEMIVGGPTPVNEDAAVLAIVQESNRVSAIDESDLPSIIISDTVAGVPIDRRLSDETVAQVKGGLEVTAESFAPLWGYFAPIVDFVSDALKPAEVMTVTTPGTPALEGMDSVTVSKYTSAEGIAAAEAQKRQEILDVAQISETGDVVIPSGWLPAVPTISQLELIAAGTGIDAKIIERSEEAMLTTPATEELEAINGITSDQSASMFPGVEMSWDTISTDEPTSSETSGMDPDDVSLVFSSTSDGVPSGSVESSARVSGVALVILAAALYLILKK